MKKLYEKDPVWFAVLWILIYVIGFGNADNLSQAMGIPKLLTCVLGIALSVLLYGFIRRQGLAQHFGLCAFRGSLPAFLYFLPLLAISSVNLWYGFVLQESARNILLYILSMCCVGFLEEVIFRGLLFKGLCQINVRTAILVSSLTFGMGHIVNLLLGAPLFETLLQLINASAIGFCYTTVFYAGGSILPCILSHAFINCSSIFARDPSAWVHILTTVIQLILNMWYGFRLLRRSAHLTNGENGL